jgi:dynein heavy chain, axonemal
LTLTDL